MKLNLGCGDKPDKGFVNVDIRKADGVDLVHNLNVFPYPFPNASADYIKMCHVLEHLEKPLLVLKECHRILKRGGMLWIEVPQFTKPGALTYFGHLHYFDFRTMNTLKNYNTAVCNDFTFEIKNVYLIFRHKILNRVFNKMKSKYTNTILKHIFPTCNIVYELVKP